MRLQEGTGVECIRCQLDPDGSRLFSPRDYGMLPHIVLSVCDLIVCESCNESPVVTSPTPLTLNHAFLLLAHMVSPPLCLQIAIIETVVTLGDTPGELGPSTIVGAPGHHLFKYRASLVLVVLRCLRE